EIGKAFLYRNHHRERVASADGSARQEPAVLVVSNQQRLERSCAGPSDHHEVVGFHRLDLQPEWAALARHIWALRVFCNHAFESALETRLKKLDAVLFDVVRHEDVSTRLDRLTQARAPAPDWLPQQRLLLKVERVEREVGDWDLVSACSASDKPFAQSRVVRSSIRIRSYELTVDHAARWHARRRRCHLGQVCGEVLEATVLKVHLAFGIAKQHAAQAIPFHLEE